MRFTKNVNGILILGLLSASCLHAQQQSLTSTAENTSSQEPLAGSQPGLMTASAGQAGTPTVEPQPSQDLSLGFDATEIASFDLAYEKQILGDQSIRFRATYGILGDSSDAGYPDGDYTFDTNVFGLGIGWLYYFTHSGDLRGWNLGPALCVYDLHNENSTQLSSDGYLFSIGLFGGYQWIISRHLLLSTRIGVVRNLLIDDLTNNNNPAVAPTTYDAWSYDFEILNIGWAFNPSQGGQETTPPKPEDENTYPNPVNAGLASPPSATPLVYDVGTEIGATQGMLPNVDSSGYYYGWLASRGWFNLNESQVNRSEGLFDGVYVKAEVYGHFTLGIGQRNYYFGQSSAVATGYSGSGAFYHWIQINETLTGNAQEYYSTFGTPYAHLTRNIKIFASSEVGFINTTIDDATTLTGYNGGDLGQHIDIGAASTSMQYGLVGGLEWDFLRHVALSADLGYQMFTPHTTTVTSVTTNTGIFNASSQTQSDLRNADGSNINIDFTGLTGSLDLAWTW